MTKKKAVKFLPLPSWTTDVLQGVTFWIGYRRSYYKDYPLLEGAIVAELCNLLSSKINPSSDGGVFCEVPISNLIQDHTSRAERDTIRYDLLIAKESKPVRNSRQHNFFDSASIVIEVKRGSASRNEIGRDLQRLAHLNWIRPNIRTFLLIVSEDKLPRQFPWFADAENPDELVAARNPIYLEEISAVMKVRRICKALSSVKASSAHTAVLIEVISTR